MTRLTSAIVLAALLAGCSGGGGSAPIAALPATNPTSAPTNAPTQAPTSAPTTTHVAVAAPLSANPATLQALRRAQANTAFATPPVLIEASAPTGMSGVWAGDFMVWVTDTLTQTDVPEASMTILASNTLLQIDSPVPTPVSTADPNSAWSTAHPFGWVFGTDAGTPNHPVGKITLHVSFPDGASINLADNVYNGWSMGCGQSIALQPSGPAGVTSNADITYDCTNQQVVFPNGYVLAAAPLTDAYGQQTTNIANVTTAVAVPNGSPTTLAFSALQTGAVYVTKTADGAFAKVYPFGAGGLNFGGMSLRSQSNGSYAY